MLSAWCAWVVLGCHGVVRLVGFGLSQYCPFGPRGRAVTVLSVWSAWAVLGCHGVVRLVGFAPSRCCPLGPLGRLWVVTVLSAWSVLGCHGGVRLGGFGLVRCCPLGRFWAVTVLSAWAVLSCHGVVRLVGFGLLRYCPLGPLGRFWVVTVISSFNFINIFRLFRFFSRRRYETRMFEKLILYVIIKIHSLSLSVFSFKIKNIWVTMNFHLYHFMNFTISKTECRRHKKQKQTRYTKKCNLSPMN